MKIRIEYFAMLREQRGCSNETLETSAPTPRALYDELRDRHNFSLDPASLQVAVNEDFSEWDHALANGDTVVYIPPVAGG